jgi:hypothetical protein
MRVLLATFIKSCALPISVKYLNTRYACDAQAMLLSVTGMAQTTFPTWNSIFFLYSTEKVRSK